MKKHWFAAVCIAALTIASCSKSPSDYAREMVKYENEIREYSSQHDYEKVVEVQQKMLPLLKEVQQKMREDSVFRAEYIESYTNAKRK